MTHRVRGRQERKATTEVPKKVETIISRMRSNPRNVRFSDAVQVCDAVFGTPRGHATSHRVYPTPWSGQPRVNLQNRKGMAKPYQVRQVLKAVDRVTTEKQREKIQE